MFLYLDMNLFTISDLQRYTGVNVHSIRAWEKRYNALTPHRTKGNTRYYDAHQLRRLLNIVSLMEDNYKISDLCSMPDIKLTTLLKNKLESDKTKIDGDEFLVSQLVSASIGFDDYLFEKIFHRATAQYGLEHAYLKVIYPAVQRLGILWSMEGLSVAQEHFATHLIKQKIISTIDILPNNFQSEHTWLLFLPEGEFHEIGLLMANYLIRNAGQRSIYLGANVPFDTVKNTIDLVKPTRILSFLVVKDDIERDQKFVDSLAKSFTSQEIFIAADAARSTQIKKYKNVSMLNTMDGLQDNLK